MVQTFPQIKCNLFVGQLLSAVSGGALRGKKRNIAEALAEARADALKP